MNKLIILLSFFIVSLFNAQKVDGIVAVIGDEIVLESDIETQYQMAKAEGAEVGNKCEFINTELLNKMIIYKAKTDTLITISDDEVDRNLDARFQQFVAQAGSEEELLKYYKKRSVTELKSEFRELIKNQMLFQRKVEAITGKVDVSPSEMKDFFDKHGSEFPDLNEQVEIAHITIKPEITETHKQEYIDKLKEIKKDIEEGSSFESKAKLYTEDPGSKQTGGLYANVKRGQMVKEFDAVAYNLEEGEISEPFETEFGFHIIQLEKRKGQELQLRHILLQTKPNSNEIATASKKLDSIRTLIIDGKMTFKEASFKFSDDKQTRYNAGVITNPRTDDSKWDKLALTSKVFYQISGLEDGEISKVFEDATERDNRKVVKIVKLNQTIPAHKMTLKTDYEKIRKFAMEEKKNILIEEWVKKQIPDTYIKIDDDYKNCSYTYDWLKEGDIAKN